MLRAFPGLAAIPVAAQLDEVDAEHEPDEGAHERDDEHPDDAQENGEGERRRRDTSLAHPAAGQKVLKGDAGDGDDDAGREDPPRESGPLHQGPEQDATEDEEETGKNGDDDADESDDDEQSGDDAADVADEGVHPQSTT